MTLALFPTQKPLNLLPKDGEAWYFDHALPQAEADDYLVALQDQLDWRHDDLLMFGKRIITKRKVAWYGDKPYRYVYSHTPKTALPWPDILVQIKQQVEVLCQQDLGACRFNSCLANLYHDGDEGMGWHSDDEPELVPGGAIASLSLGAERNFAFKHKRDKTKAAQVLAHGSLLVMQGACQSCWQHSLTKTRKAVGLRVNLTFRQIREDIL